MPVHFGVGNRTTIIFKVEGFFFSTEREVSPCECLEMVRASHGRGARKLGVWPHPFLTGLVPVTSSAQASVCLSENNEVNLYPFHMTVEKSKSTLECESTVKSR